MYAPYVCRYIFSRNVSGNVLRRRFSAKCVEIPSGNAAEMRQLRVLARISDAFPLPDSEEMSQKVDARTERPALPGVAPSRLCASASIRAMDTRYEHV